MTYTELLLFGERLRVRRNALGFTQEYMSEQVDITVRYYQMIERGEKNVSVDTLIRLSRVLQISIDYLLLGDLSHSLEDPVTKILCSLSPKQRADAEKILTIYADACKKKVL